MMTPPQYAAKILLWMREHEGQSSERILSTAIADAMEDAYNAGISEGMEYDGRLQSYAQRKRRDPTLVKPKVEQFPYPSELYEEQ